MENNQETGGIDSLKKILIGYLLFSIFIFIAFCTYKLNLDGLTERNLCFAAKCFSTLFNSLAGTMELIDFLIKIVVAIVTVYGVYFALINYINSIQTSKTNIHLTHMSTFKEYILFELDGSKQLNKESFDVFKWYNFIFSNSRGGSIDVSNDYISMIKSLNNEIKLSNNTFRTRDFPYIKHQKRIISQLGKIGIKLSLMPRNDFYEVEKQLFNLIEKVNEEYCSMKGEGKLFKRNYR
ncbi:retron Ec48 family effector membrane protein [Shewanella glacialipiscicola]|uniref:retron Ec48 family effector membrane protein n=1 Tax=Shewanella glacialipiscicola TaxID=614069 RepID=UPI0021D8ECB6|nr:retron Ec48 family effector membrane protein [Shewanella glacialipiscicola]MCU7994115.1 retron Ec48 family effector membrane protein [Shewanella glacialipiscicola]MCU8025433.1 retron Ec48 family effector membrane protein [Shewanella glacialipiscicola]